MYVSIKVRDLTGSSFGKDKTKMNHIFTFYILQNLGRICWIDRFGRNFRGEFDIGGGGIIRFHEVMYVFCFIFSIYFCMHCYTFYTYKLLSKGKNGEQNYERWYQIVFSVCVEVFLAFHLIYELRLQHIKKYLILLLIHVSYVKFSNIYSF